MPPGKVEKKLKTSVVHVRYNLANDWSGERSISFRILFSDDASNKAQIHATARKVTEALIQEVKPHQLGLEPYFNFRSESEQRQLNEAAWA